MAKQKTVVVGAGPVGSLAAIYAAARGDEVEIYDLRGDLRDASTVPLNFTKSINLALSERGINSLRSARCESLLEAILDETIPMNGRMIHSQEQGTPTQESQAYDIHGRFIRAVDRAGLNKRLLDELERMPNVKFCFNHKLVGADFRRRVAWFERKDPKHARRDHAQNPTQDRTDGSKLDPKGTSQEIEVSFDFLIGADGAHSSVRYHLMKYTRMNYTQEYIDTLWCEFHISPKPSSQSTMEDSSKATTWAISPNHLHIWPGGPERMFIAIPSLDHSFTCTLFTSEATYKHLDANSKERLIPFFRENFPGVVPDLISEANIQQQYSENPHLPLISIKCTPYHYDSSVVILGDAAHAMVPFYGQGMNAGLEDVRVLYENLDAHMPKDPTPDSLRAARAKALAAYTSQRHPDAVAINDLALRNYREMASDVKSPLYLFRKGLEERLSVLFPSLGWATQYSRVSFGNVRYSEVERLAEKQRRILLYGILGTLGVVSAWGAWMIWSWKSVERPPKGIYGWFVHAVKRMKEWGRMST